MTKKTASKILSLLVAVCLLPGMLPVTAYAASHSSVMAENPDFGTVSEGYSQPEEREASITFYGVDGSYTGISASLNKGDDSAFVIAQGLSSTTIDSTHNTLTLSVRPKANLPVGLYSEQVIITGSDSLSGYIFLTFEVCASASFGASIDPNPHTFPEQEFSYFNPQVKQVFTLTNTGTARLSGLKAALQSGEDFEIENALSPQELTMGNRATVKVQSKSHLLPGTYTDTLQIIGDNGEVATASLSFTITAATPAIITRPSDQNVAAGGSVTFTVDAVGNPEPTYTWYQSLNGSTWEPVQPNSIVSLVGNNLHLQNIPASYNGYQYRVDVANSKGAFSTTPVTLTVTGSDAPRNIIVEGNSSLPQYSYCAGNGFEPQGKITISNETTYGTASGNTLTIKSGDFTSDWVFFYGGYTERNGEKAENNQVFVNGGNFTGAYQSISGGQSKGHSKNNTVTLNNFTGALASVHGSGLSSGGDAAGNKVVITSNSGKIEQVIGGFAMAAATDNTVEIKSDGIKIGQFLCGGQTAMGSATNNTVTISGSANLSGALLKGGAAYSSGDAFTGNKLNLNVSGQKVMGLGGFEYYNFKLPSAISNGSTMLTVTHGNGNSYPSYGPADIGNTKISINFDGKPTLSKGDKIILIDSSEKGFTGAPETTSVTVSGYTFALAVEGGKLTATVTAASSTGGNGGSGNGSSSGKSSTTSASGSQSDQSVTATVSVTSTAGANGAASASVAVKTIADVIAKAQADAKAQGKTDSGINLSITLNNPASTRALDIMLSQPVLNQLTAAKVQQLELNGQLLTLNFNQKAINQIQSQSSGDVTIAIQPVTIQGVRNAYDITLNSVKDGKAELISNLGKGSVTLSIPYTPAANENTGRLYAVYVDKNGKLTRIDGSAYDTKSRSMVFSTNHFSVYGIGYDSSFTDTGSHWAKESIDYVVNRGLFSGLSDGTFRPDTAITRGDFVTALGRLSSVNKGDYTKSSFTDIKADAYYLPYVEWAYKNGIIQGTGSSQFAPNRAITREEIASVLQNYTKATGYKLLTTSTTVPFTDDSSISNVFKEAVTVMHQAGILKGDQNNRFNPKSSTTRAEVSTILQRYIPLTVDSSKSTN